MNKNAKTRLILFASIFLIFAAYGVLASYASVFSGGTSFNFNDSATNTYNITINNTGASDVSNITQVNITLPASFAFVANSNWTDSNALSFSNSSNIYLSWQNSNGLVMNLTCQYFAFAATSATPAT